MKDESINKAKSKEFDEPVLDAAWRFLLRKVFGRLSSRV